MSLRLKLNGQLAQNTFPTLTSVQNWQTMLIQRWLFIHKFIYCYSLCVKDTPSENYPRSREILHYLYIPQIPR